MEFKEGLKLEGAPAYIPDCPRDNLPQLLVELGMKVGAEVGVYKAGYTEKFCKAGLRMFGVDPWIAYGGAGRTQTKQDRQDFLYEHAQRILEPYGKLATLIRKKSADALADFKDGSLDFVYVDGDHEFPNAAIDIYGWSKKVRSGGVVSGHDWFDVRVDARNVICHVKSVVNAYVRLAGIQKWWVFGKLEREDWKTKDDRYWSWMWIKP